MTCNLHVGAMHAVIVAKCCKGWGLRLDPESGCTQPEALWHVHAEAYLGRTVSEAVITVPGAPFDRNSLVLGVSLLVASRKTLAVSQSGTCAAVNDGVRGGSQPTSMTASARPPRTRGALRGWM